MKWKTEYLTTLQKRNKWSTEEKAIQVGDIVLFKDVELFQRARSLAKMVKTFLARMAL